MAVLHGSWQICSPNHYFFIWLETWRRVSEPILLPDIISNPNPELGIEALAYPYALNTSELTNWFTDHPQPWFEPGAIASETIGFPTAITPKTRTLSPIYPGASDRETHANHPNGAGQTDLTLYPWRVSGIRLESSSAFKFLSTLPLGNTMESEIVLGEDLRFWSQVTRWTLDLLARGKFLPTLQHQRGEFIARWQPLLDGAVDQGRFLRFASKMPTIHRLYQSGLTPGDGSVPKPVTPNAPALNLPQSSGAMLSQVLQGLMDAQVRQAIVQVEHIAHPNRFPESVAAWLRGLGENPPRVQVENLEELTTLETTLKTWSASLPSDIDEYNAFRVGFQLLPPSPNRPGWELQYGLQAIDDPEFVIDALTIWQHPVEVLTLQGRTIRFPQETLLRGLGVASRLYPVLDESLQMAQPQSCPLTPMQAYEFLKTTAWRFADSGLGVILPPSLANREGWANRLGLSLKSEALDLDPQKRLGLGSLLNFQWKISIGGQTLTKAEFDQLVAQKSPLVEVNGEWVELRPTEVRAVESFFASRKNKMELTLEDALRLATGDTQTIEKLPVVRFESEGRLEEILQTLTANRPLEELETPKQFQGELRPYQAKGVSWLAFLEKWGLGACLADDMGLGKTIELIAFLLHLQEQNALNQPVLLVCPTSVLGNWEREVKRFAPTLKILVHHGEKRAKGQGFARAVQSKNLVMTSYSLAFRDEKSLKIVAWQGIVLDEAQNIKNPEAKQSKVIRTLEAGFKIALTGTPVENRLSELWSIMDFLNPGYLGQLQFFQRRFAIPIEKYGDTDSLQSLRSLVQPFILRRLKTDKEIIQDLPEKQENTVFCSLATEQAAIYQQTIDEFLNKIDNSTGIQRRGLILALLVRLKQLCNHPSLIHAKSQKTAEKRQLNTQQSGKLQRLDEMLEELLSEGDRALIFTQFSEWGKLLQPYLEQRLNCKTLFLYGGTRRDQREEIVDQFQHDPQGPPILILSLKAGGVGLNLTRANHVFHFDRWWNPAVENQATDRAFRIGQTRNVQVHKFVCSGTLEEKIHDLIESKRALADQIVGTGEDWLTELDTDQLRDLLLLDRNSVIEEDE
ncbi:MAG: DEAD/DEAH box helicase [Oscillatoriales cyanobacterium RM2_1_1]|nr:DEAD/DEAH box helicase [Oscillatoriales cyanobacterium SM2_3_0]NJO44227.1 DEAD/DEAH box helicase [Oscillatoriales cyanobacterium RM2_1_1]